MHQGTRKTLQLDTGTAGRQQPVRGKDIENDGSMPVLPAPWVGVHVLAWMVSASRFPQPGQNV